MGARRGMVAVATAALLITGACGTRVEGGSDAGVETAAAAAPSSDDGSGGSGGDGGSASASEEGMVGTLPTPCGEGDASGARPPRAGGFKPGAGPRRDGPAGGPAKGGRPPQGKGKGPKR